MSEQDMHFISGDFFDYDVPKEKRYLLKYFKTEVQQVFLRYFLVFGDIRNFVPHTGCYCTQRLLRRLQTDYNKLVRYYQSSKESLDEEGMMTIHLLELGKILKGRVRNEPAN